MRALTPIVAVAGLGAFAAPALAHHLEADRSAPPGWTLDAGVTVPLAVSALLFAIGWTRLRARCGPGAPAIMRRAGLFGAGWLTLAAALVSPLHEAGERSFALHMFEHELLMLCSAPLLVLSEPLAVMLWAFPASGRRTLGRLSRSAPVRLLWRRLTAPVTATVLQAVALWLWHMPSLFDLALAREGWHAAQHLSFLLSALLFWSAMLSARGGRASRIGDQAAAALCLFATSVVSGALGAIMAFSESPWYAGYAHLGMAPFGLTPAEDQQVAGLIMWVPGGLVHAGAALALVAAALRPAPERTADAL
jgi:cytochrome c oxidase assembly factor CtaG